MFRLIAQDRSAEEIKLLCLLRWNKIRVLTHTNSRGEYWVKFKRNVFKVSARQMVALTSTLDFIDEIPPRPVRLSHIGKHRPVEANFNGVSFEVYLYCDNLFQGYLHTENLDILKDMVKVLYDAEDIDPSKSECIMAFYWFASLKRLMAERFPHFYQPIDSVTPQDLLQSESLHQKLTNAVNAQIRALTNGDVTKENYVMKMDTIRALTELDAKAWEAEQIKKQK